MVFFADLHIHSKASKDGIADAKDIIKVCSRKKIEVVAITDHNSFESYYKVVELANDLGILLIPGVEIKTDKGDLLVYGKVEKIEDLLDYAKENNSSIDVIEKAKENKLMVFLPHPYAILFHYSSSFHKAARDVAKLVDGIEIFNSRTLFWNYKACELSKEFKKMRICGSDAHSLVEIGNAYTIVYGKKPETIKDFFKILGKAKVEFFGKRITPGQYIKWMARRIKDNIAKNIIDF